MKTQIEAADWMLQQIKDKGMLYQDFAADFLRKNSTSFADYNDEGQLRINNNVLASFKKLGNDSIVYVRADRYWRPRGPHDLPGRQQ
jgi:hypothetical protein